MKILELTLDDILELGPKPNPQKFIERIQIYTKEGEKEISLKSAILKAIDDAFWKLVQSGKTEEEAFGALGIGMPKANEGKPDFKEGNRNNLAALVIKWMRGKDNENELQRDQLSALDKGQTFLMAEMGKLKKAQDLEKLVQRQAEEKALPSPDDDDPIWEVDEAYLDELASRVEAGVKGD